MDLELNGRIIMFSSSSDMFLMTGRLLEKYGIDTVFCGSDRQSCLAALNDHRPDIFVYVCGTDDSVNIADISSAAKETVGTTLFAVSPTNCVSRLSAYERAGALRTVIMPIEPERLALLLRTFLIAGPDSKIPDIADFLYISGFTVTTKGFIPLCHMIEVCCEHPYCLNHPSKSRLTHSVAVKFGWKGANLDRLIRYIAVKEYDKRTISRMTGRKVWWRPGNIPFVAILCDKYLTYRRGVPHKLPSDAPIVQPEVKAQEIIARKHKRKWIYVGKPKADRTDT